ncbi:hypothetical protein EV122DRAFT_261161 [Schizophyllum commune]
MLSASTSTASNSAGGGAGESSGSAGMHHLNTTDLKPTLRPVFTRQESVNILSYYQSPLADQGISYAQQQQHQPSDAPAQRPPLRQRTLSGGSSSSSNYSAASDTEARSASSPASSRPRSSIPSDGGSDRRRVAIVELDQPQDHRKTRSSESGADDVLAESPGLRSRRGFRNDLHGLALVAPPDASPRAYSMQAPPSSAPSASGERRETHHHTHHGRSASEATQPPRANKGKRAIGIVGTTEQENAARARETARRTLQPPVLQYPQSRSPSPGGTSEASEPRQRSPTRFTVSSAHPPFSRRTTEQSILMTPEIGQEKDVTTRVAAPVIYDLHDQSYSPPSSHSSSPRIVVDSPAARKFQEVPSSYLSYQPGVHSTAGPLPPPPRTVLRIDPATPPPPRPPRLHSPPVSDSSAEMDSIRKAMTLPANVSSAISSRVLRTPGSDIHAKAPTKSSEATMEDVDSVGSSSFSQNSHLVSRPSVHWREGAFPPSVNTSSTSSSEYSGTSPPLEDDPTISRSISHISHQASETLTERNIGPSIARDPSPARGSSLAHEPRSESPTEIRVESPEGKSQWLDMDSEYEDRGSRLTRYTSSATGHSSSRASHSPTRTESNLDHSEGLPSPPPKSFRNSFAVNVKRFSSLPRTPMSPTSDRRIRHGLSLDRGPSPPISIPLPHAPRPHKRKKDPYPSALFCAEVHSERNTVERCSIYIEKINELYNYDSGLGDWIAAVKFKSTVERSKPYLQGVSSPPMTQTPRHPSRGSEISEVTFPVRLDSTTATDLTARSGDSLAPTSPPPELPYQSLANSLASSPGKSPIPLRASPLTNTPPTSLRSLVAPHKPGFFASLGRKTSVKRERPQISSPMSPPGPKVLTKSPPSASRPPVTLPSASSPSVPGGPRALPSRHLSRRSHTAFPGMQRFSAQPGMSGAMSDSGHSRTTHAHTSLLRRPSLSAVPPLRSSSSSPPKGTPTSKSGGGGKTQTQRDDPEFKRQLENLMNLLPHADKDTLSGYLRRTGQDMLALGQYIDDEKNGRVRRD